MIKTIFKYPLEVIDEQTIEMPSGAQILTVQMQRGLLYLWALVPVAAPMMQRRIITHGTEHPVPPTTGEYIGTYQLDGGSLIFHVFEAEDEG